MMRTTFTILLNLLLITSFAQSNKDLTITINSEREAARGYITVKQGNSLFIHVELTDGMAYVDLAKLDGIKSSDNSPLQITQYPNPVSSGNINLIIEGIKEEGGQFVFYNDNGAIIGHLDVNNEFNKTFNNSHGIVLYSYISKDGEVYRGKFVSLNKSLNIHVSYNGNNAYLKSVHLANDQYQVQYYNTSNILLREETISVGDNEHKKLFWDVTEIKSMVYEKVSGVDGNSDLIRNEVSNQYSLGGNSTASWYGGSGSNEKHLVVYLDSTRLKSVGDEISVTLEYKAGNKSNGLNQSNTTPYAIRFGLFNEHGLQVVSGTGLSNSYFSDYTGYFGAHAVPESSTPAIFERNTGQKYLILGNSGTQLGTGEQSGKMTSGQNRTLKLIIKRTSEGNKITYTQDGTGSFNFSVEDTVNIETKFNTIAIGLDDSPELIDWFWIYELYVEHKTYTHPVIYNLSVENGTGSGSYFEGSKHIIEANAVEPGKVFDSWTGDIETVEDLHAAQTVIDMPDKDIKVKATYRDAVNYTLSIENGNGSGSYPERSWVPIAANPPAEGEVFDKWTGDIDSIKSASSMNTEIFMPSHNISLTATYKPGDGRIQLPIEIMGLPPYSEGIELNLGASGDIAEKLYVQVHNISYDNKGSIRVNGGEWIGLNNQDTRIQMSNKEKQYGGFGGGFATIKLALAKPDIEFKDGYNTIEFRYNFKAAPTAGFRVLNVNILDIDGNKLISDTVFYQDDPTTWEAPLNNETDIQAGEKFWRSQYLGQKAHCMDCHNQSGMDLKYFNVSNKTIIEQVIKSGFTRKEGEQVASYIRSIDIPVVPQARVYNPPYQPGPGTDSRPVYEWAAGAGLEWVLEDDEAMLPYIFGDGSRDSIDLATDITSDLNLREMPVSVMFPDYLAWIPRTHPMDIWGDAWDESINGHNAGKAYAEMRQAFLTKGAEGLAAENKLKSTLDGYLKHVMWWLGTNNNTGHPWTGTKATMLDKRKPEYTAEYAKHNLALHQSIKMLEIMMEFEVQDKYDANTPERAKREKYVWPVEQFVMFVVPAHFTGDDRGTSHFAWESPEVGAYFSSIWYQLQITVSPGRRQTTYGVAPSDWSYNIFHINRLGERTGVYEPLRQAQNIIKCYQQRDQPTSLGINKNTWIMREVSPWRSYSDYKGDQSTMLKMNEYLPDLRANFTSSIINQWLIKSNEFEIDDWPRTNTIGFGSDYWEKLEYANYDPTGKTNPGNGAGKLFAPDGSFDAVEAHAFYRLLDGNYKNGQNRLEEIGVDYEVIKGMADWADKMWTNPATDWYSWE